MLSLFRGVLLAIRSHPPGGELTFTLVNTLDTLFDLSVGDVSNQR